MNAAKDCAMPFCMCALKHCTLAVTMATVLRVYVGTVTHINLLHMDLIQIYRESNLGSIWNICQHTLNH